MKVEIGNYEDNDERKISVHIDPWDTWDMHCTLGYIVLPMLKQLKETRNGSGMVDDEDVYHMPKQGVSSNESSQFDLFASEENDGVIWDQYTDRWDWVLDEMIYAFESISGFNQDWENKYHTGVFDRISVPVDKEGNEVPEEEAEYFEWRKTDKDTSHWDRDAYMIEAERIRNGFRLFGKYFQSLWD